MADVAGALGVAAAAWLLAALESGFAVGSSEALKPLLSIFPPASPHFFSLCSLCRLVWSQWEKERETERERKGRSQANSRAWSKVS